MISQKFEINNNRKTSRNEMYEVFILGGFICSELLNSTSLLHNFQSSPISSSVTK